MAVILVVRNCLYLSRTLFEAVHQQNLENATNRLPQQDTFKAVHQQNLEMQQTGWQQTFQG